MQIRGTVQRKTVASGSKSEREAVVIVTDGREYILRFAGGTAFADPRLDDLVGKRIRAEGEVTGNTFLMRTCMTE